MQRRRTGGKRGVKSRRKELIQFTEEHGHRNVPSEHSGGLGDWVPHPSSEKESGSLDARRIQNLEELGFQRRWGRDGHCHVSPKNPGGLENSVPNQHHHIEKGSQCHVEDNAASAKLSYPMKQGGKEHTSNACPEPARSSRGTEATEQTRQQMQAAAARGDYILAGKLQEGSHSWQPHRSRYSKLLSKMTSFLQGTCGRS